MSEMRKEEQNEKQRKPITTKKLTVFSRNLLFFNFFKHRQFGAANIVRSIDKYVLKEYNYRYEEEKSTHSSEYSISLNSNETVTEKILLNTVHYFF